MEISEYEIWRETSKQPDLLDLLEDALGYEYVPGSPLDELEAEVAKTIVRARLDAALVIYGRLQAGEDVSDAEIDLDALLIVSTVIKRLEQDET